MENPTTRNPTDFEPLIPGTSGGTGEAKLVPGSDEAKRLAKIVTANLTAEQANPRLRRLRAQRYAFLQDLIRQHGPTRSQLVIDGLGALWLAFDQSRDAIQLTWEQFLHRALFAEDYPPPDRNGTLRERRRLRDDYKAKCKANGVRVTDEMIVRAASETWHSRTQIQKWLKGDPRYDGAPDRLIRKVFRTKPHLPPLQS
jgi:hypothetical protein